MRRPTKPTRAAAPAVAYVEPTDAQKLGFLKDRLERHSLAARTHCDDWARDRFRDNPLRALEWADSIFDSAAEYEVTVRLRHWLDREVKQAEETLEHFDMNAWLQEARERLTTDALREARSPSRSTSQTSNRGAQALAAAQAKWADQLHGWCW